MNRFVMFMFYVRHLYSNRLRSVVRLTAFVMLFVLALSGSRLAAQPAAGEEAEAPATPVLDSPGGNDNASASAERGGTDEPYENSLPEPPQVKNSSLVAVDDFEEYTLIGRQDNLRSRMGFGFHGYGDRGLSWRGALDYYVSDSWSLKGLLAIQLSQADLTDRPVKFREDFGAFGMDIHLFNIGDFDFFVGGAAGFSLFHLDPSPGDLKVTPTVELGYGVALHGSFFMLIFEATHRITDFQQNGVTFEIHEWVYSPGFGVKF